MGKHVARVIFRRSNFSTVTFAGFQRRFDAQQLSSIRRIGADRVVYLSGSGISTCQQQHQQLRILSRQLLLGLPDSQSLCLRTRLSDRALFWEAQLLTCLRGTPHSKDGCAHTLSNLEPSQQPFEDLEQSCQAFWCARAEATSAYKKFWALDDKVHPHHRWRLLP